MRKLGGFVTAVAIAAAFVATIPFTARAANSYDGNWTVTIMTQSGNCPSSLRYGVRVDRGRVLADGQSYQVNGSVAANGATRVTVSEQGQSATGTGRLSGKPDSAGRAEVTVSVTLERPLYLLDESDLKWGRERVVTSGTESYGNGKQTFVIEVAP